MKRLFSKMCTGFVLTAICVTPAYAADLTITLDGSPIVFTDAHPYVDENDRTMIPLRAVGEALDYQVEWLPEDQIAHLYRHEQQPYSESKELLAKYPDLTEVSYEDIFLKENKWEICWSAQYALVSNGKPIPDVSLTAGEATYTMDTLTVVKDGRTYIPLRALLGVISEPIAVSWEGASNTVRLTHTSSFVADDSWYTLPPLHEMVYWLPDDLNIPSISY